MYLNYALVRENDREGSGIFNTLLPGVHVNDSLFLKQLDLAHGTSKTLMERTRQWNTFCNM